MKNKKQIIEKLEEVKEFEDECELMANCVATGVHPRDSGYEFKTFDDLDLAFKVSSGHWMERSIHFMKVAECLEWVLK